MYGWKIKYCCSDKQAGLYVHVIIVISFKIYSVTLPYIAILIYMFNC